MIGSLDLRTPTIAFTAFTSLWKWATVGNWISTRKRKTRPQMENRSQMDMHFSPFKLQSIWQRALARGSLCIGIHIKFVVLKNLSQEMAEFDFYFTCFRMRMTHCFNFSAGRFPDDYLQLCLKLVQWFTVRLEWKGNFGQRRIWEGEEGTDALGPDKQNKCFNFFRFWSFLVVFTQIVWSFSKITWIWRIFC